MTRPADRPADRPVARPVLAPGLQVRQHGPTELQIGLTERHRLRIADTAAVRRTLAVLSRGEAPRTDLETRRVLRELAPVLRDGDSLVRPGLPAAEVAATSLAHPRTATARLDARRRSRISVVGSLGEEAPAIAALLAGSGLSVHSGHAGRASDTAPDVVLLLSVGPADREASDGLHRDGTPHLVLEALESAIVVGPFVVPGRTACLRCLDAHRAAADPRYPALVTTEPQTRRRDGVPAPVHGAQATMALGWAVGDLVRYVEGDEPHSWSATVTFAPDLATIAPRHWLRHPRCGCSWAVVMDTSSDEGRSDTMGA